MFKLRVLRGKSHNRAEGLESRVHAGVSHIFKLGVNLSSVPTGIHKVPFELSKNVFLKTIMPV